MRKYYIISVLFILALQLQAQQFFNSDNFCFAKMDTIHPGSNFSKGRILDFNKDGKKDFAVLDYSNDSILVYLNNGLANFTVTPTIREKTNSTNDQDLCVGDFNNDTYPDIATIDIWGDVSVFQNMAGASLVFSVSVANTTAPSFQPFTIEAFELNNDGKIDLIGIGQDLGLNQHAFYTVPSLGALNFGSLVANNLFLSHNLQFNFPEISLAVADFDGDGFKDFVVGSNEVVDTLEIYKNLGSAVISFSSPVVYTVTPGGPVESIIAQDLDGDGKFDLAVSASSGYSINKNTGALSFTNIHSGISFGFNAAAIKDIDSDNKPDLILVDDFGDYKLFRGLNLTGSVFDTYYTYFFAPDGDRFLLDDFDGNLIPDFVIVGKGDFPLILNFRNFSFHIENKIISTNTLICGSTPVTFTVTNSHPTYPGNYVWDAGLGLGTSYTTTTSGSVSCVFSYTLPPGYGQCALFTDSIYISSQVTPTAPISATLSAVNCPGTNVPLEASIPVYTTYTWSTGQTTSSIVVSPTTTTTYSLFLNNGCPGTETYTVTVSPNPTVTITAPSFSICSGDSLILTGNGANTYTWHPSATITNTLSVKPTVTSSYSMAGTNTFGCKDSSSVTITVNLPPVLSVVPSKTIICFPDTVVLTASGAPSYTWNTGANTSTVSLLVFSNTNYTVTGSNGCKATSTYSVNGFNRPIVTASSNFSSVCLGNPVTLQAFGATSYTWFPPIQFGSTVFDNPTAPTTYSVVGINTSGCYNYTTVSVSVNSLPSLSITSTELCVGKKATIFASGALTYTWNTGNTTAFEQVTPSNQSQLSYTVTGVDANGCKALTTQNFDVGNQCGLIVWNGVTPNGDGKNDFFYLENIEQYPGNKVSIYNRWGQRIAYIEGYDNTIHFWSGKDEDFYSDVPSGTYYYIIDLNNGSDLLKGWIELTKKSLN